MNLQQFASLVRKMRAAQVSYFRHRREVDLQNSRRLEKEVDQALKDLGQGQLFKSDEEQLGAS